MLRLMVVDCCSNLFAAMYLLPVRRFLLLPIIAAGLTCYGQNPDLQIVGQVVRADDGRLIAGATSTAHTVHRGSTHLPDRSVRQQWRLQFSAGRGG